MNEKSEQNDIASIGLLDFIDNKIQEEQRLLDNANREGSILSERYKEDRSLVIETLQNVKAFMQSNKTKKKETQI